MYTLQMAYRQKVTYINQFTKRPGASVCAGPVATNSTLTRIYRFSAMSEMPTTVSTMPAKE